jgi:hypothetical protein
MAGIFISGSSRLKPNLHLASQKHKSSHTIYGALSNVVRYLRVDCKFYLSELNNGELVSGSSYNEDGL